MSVLRLYKMAENRSVNEFYDGSVILWPFSELTGLPMDHTNFLASQLTALAFGYIYRVYCGPHKVSPTCRHFIQILIGVPLTYFCFGRQIIHLLAQSLICFALMRFLEPGVMEKVVLIVAMAYLCVCHTYRMIYDYGGYTLDITGPLMVNTQRLTSLAFNIRDGRLKDNSKLTSLMKHLAVRDYPSVIEVLSYVFCFHGIMCGPFCFYSDYVAFINGSSYNKLSNSLSYTAERCDVANMQQNNSVRHSDSDELQSANNHSRQKSVPPPPGFALYQKLFTATFYGIMTVWVLPRFPRTIITGAQFKQHGFFMKMWLILFFAALQRQKYYFAWKLGESVNVNAGLGFNGYDKDGNARWDLIDNADITKVELSSSLKELLDNWNRSTTYWLRYVIYDRLHSTVAVFFFSAFWHGFYAGYYITFFTGGIFIHTARLMRRRVRPLFLSTRQLKFVYDAITFTATRIAIAYLGFPFLVLELHHVLEIYSNVYFWMHIAAITLVVAVLILPLHTKDSKSQ
jgi:lysophospholipid acyltransferase 1/2